ncbi:hypothetical protein DGG96_10740 [Legionella qingyii]|uniref:Peptidase C58 YopT-type domain-containing protein n=1 Tax=Legionella qingyii TaxID=2184757 RepID=A0A317U0N3_9GAMM|nr:hypothetical protein [Legionella qingyii]PWY55583.1 hypothetical protein DGG96_10740 [Legionella qingyii]RUR21822.1 hypothetical protein ELY20_11430 [Legionella qingyii]RUR25250.1 hypothetical protein ELY16_09920 [Legionella qingyii]
MNKILNLKQSSQTLIGDCYGYSLFWAKGKLVLPKDAEKSKREIPLTLDIDNAQWSQFIPNKKSAWTIDIYMDWRKEQIQKDIQEMLIQDNDTVILKYFGLIGGHALAIKKIADDRYQYFDCNDGIYEFSTDEFSKIINKITSGLYGKTFYAFGMEKISTSVDFDPNIIKNIFAATVLICAKILTSPIGIGRLAFTLFEIISEQCNQLIKNLSDFLLINPINDSQNTLCQ